MLTDNGLPLDDLQCVQQFGREAIEPDKHQAIDLAEGQPLDLRRSTLSWG